MAVWYMETKRKKYVWARKFLGRRAAVGLTSLGRKVEVEFGKRQVMIV